jgi:outer membrane protein TolC
MSVLSKLIKMTLPALFMFLAGCQTVDLAQNPFDTLRSPKSSKNNGALPGAIELNGVLSLKDVTAQAAPVINVGSGFSRAVASAVRSDPKVQMARSEFLQKQASLGVTKSQLDFQFSGTIYAGIEDLTDNTNGIAAVLNASKVIYDGGQISNRVAADEFAVQSALESYRATLDARALDVSTAWVKLEQYQSLNALISDRLSVLDPLITKLEQIADAGVGDATQVAAAQRTVAMIRVTQTDIQESLAQAELNFIRLLGELPEGVKFDAIAVAKAVPNKITNKMALASPVLMASYAAYLGSREAFEVAKARNSITVGFQTKVQRPFGQSGYDSDESIGFVVKKTLYNGGKVASEIRAAKANADRQEANVKDVYRRGKQVVDAALQSIASMDKSIVMARSNAQALNDEIILLRKQLVIGQSTLDSVLAAEARLYDAESKEIQFVANKRVSQLNVLSAIGRLSPLVGIKASLELK